MIVVEIAGLGARTARLPALSTFEWHAARPEFPALTCPAQATLRTALPPDRHGIVFNGTFNRALRRPFFWDQSAGLVAGSRIWHGFRARGGTVGLLFWQQSLGEDVELILSPAPIHKHHGGMIDTCYSRPAPLYPRLVEAVGRPFRLRDYWGPTASLRASEWITEALVFLLRSPELRTDLMFSYLPHLDYAFQKHGPVGPQAEAAVEELARMLARIRKAAEAAGYDYLFFGDYAFEEVPGGAVMLNQVLRTAGYFSIRRVGRHTYPDFFAARAFAVTDHQVAHVFVRNEEAQEAVASLLAGINGVEKVLPAEEAFGRKVETGGDLVAIASRGYWFAYPWWSEPAEEPDYAGHVDIHNKPGYDPCEMFFGRVPWRISRDPTRVRGSHGRLDGDLLVAWSSSADLRGETLLELAVSLREWLSRD